MTDPHCMERQRRSASKVTDFRRYHLSGDLEQVVSGKVSQTIERLEREADTMSHPINEENSSLEELQEELREQQQNSAKIQQQVEIMKVRNELEKEKLAQEQWAAALEQLKKTREEVALEHE